MWHCYKKSFHGGRWWPGLRQPCPRGVSFTHPWESDHSLWDLEESPRTGPRACVLDGADCCTGLRKEALAMETGGHIPSSPHPGCVPLAN